MNMESFVLLFLYGPKTSYEQVVMVGFILTTPGNFGVHKLCSVMVRFV